MKLIQTNDYLLLIDEEAEIKENDTVLSCIDNEIIENFPNIGLDKAKKDNNNKIVAYYPLTKEAKELDLPLLPNPFEDYTPYLEKQSEDYYEELYESGAVKLHEKSWIKSIYQEIFKRSYKAAQSNKQFSLEDMIAFGKKCFYKGFDKSESDDSNCYTAWREESSGLVQSLSTQQLPKEFIPEYEKPSDSFSSWLGTFIDGKTKIKTITNSEGKQELIGKYKYD